MSDQIPEEMSLADYLAQGGMLTSPANVPPRYRAEIMRIMAVFVDSSIAGAAGFADVINGAPGLTARIAAAKIVLQKNDHARQVLQVMGAFGANTGRYAEAHPWTDRLPRDAVPEAQRVQDDMRLPVFNFPLNGWADAVVMNLVMGLAVGVQLVELAQVSYQPLADALRRIAPVEANHARLAREGVRDLLAAGQGDEVTAALAYWRPRVALGFGRDDPARFEALRAMGLRRAANSAQRAAWEAELDAQLTELGIAPDGEGAT